MNTDKYKENSTSDDFAFEELFYLNPDLWNIFKQNNIRSIQFLRAISYRERESFWPMGGPNSFYTILSCYGNIKDPNGIYFDREQVVRWKMTRPYFLNTVYHSIDTHYER